MYPSSRHGKVQNNLRLNTGLRAPTGYKQNNITNSLAYTPELNISERPVTQQGLLGIKTGISGPKRKILSQTYFKSLLQQKIQNLTEEIAKFRLQKEKLQENKTQQETLTNKYEQFSNEVHELEGNFADYNLAFDKQRNGAKAEDVLFDQEHLAFQNQKLQTKVDEIFIQRKEYEDKIIFIKEQIGDLKNFADVKINELSADEKEEFQKLRVQVREAEQSNKLRLQKLEDLNTRLYQQEDKLRQDIHRQKVMQMKEEIKYYENRQNQLEQQFQDSNLSFEDLRKKLMDEVKESKKDIKKLEQRMKELKKLEEISQKKLIRVNNLLNGDSEMGFDQKKKYEILYNKEIEVENEMKKINQDLENRIEQIGELEKNNLQILIQISKNQNALKINPEKKNMDAINQEYQYKKVQAENSEQTLQRVQQELVRRQLDLQKVDEIEDTLPERIKVFEEMFITLNDELEYYNNAEIEKEKIQKAKIKLEEKIQMIMQNKEEIEERYKEAENDYRRKLKNLQLHPLFKKFIEKEKEMSQIYQLKFGIENYIMIKENNNNFHKFYEILNDLSEEINQNLINKKDQQIINTQQVIQFLLL